MEQMLTAGENFALLISATPAPKNLAEYVDTEDFFPRLTRLKELTLVRTEHMATPAEEPGLCNYHAQTKKGRQRRPFTFERKAFRC